MFPVLLYRNRKYWWVGVVANLFLSLCVIVSIMLFVFSCITAECIVDGASMVPTYNADSKSDNDIVYVNKYDNDYEFGDIVVVSVEGGSPIIKRVIGVGGDVVDIVHTLDGYKLEINGTIIEEDYINYKNDVTDPDLKNGMKEYYNAFRGNMRDRFPELFNEQGKLVVPDNEFLVFGDNRHVSQDSVHYGTFERQELIGTVEWSLYSGESKFAFYCDYILTGKFFTTIANCF